MKKLAVLLLAFGLTLPTRAQTASTGSSPTNTQAAQAQGTGETCGHSRDVVVDILRKELDYRLSAQWNIFSWCSTLLIAIAGGAIALQTKHANSLNTWQKAIGTVAVAILVAYGFVWLGHHADREWRVKAHLTSLIEVPIWMGRSLVGGERVPLVVLGVAALVAVWLPVRKSAETSASRNRQDS
jgi:hypothetical protein